MIRRSRSALLHVSRPTAVGVLPAYMTCANCLVRPPAAPPVISICHCRRARCSSSIIPTLLLPLPLRNKARRRRRPCAAGAACRFTSRFPADPFRARQLPCTASSRLIGNLGLFKFSLIQKQFSKFVTIILQLASHNDHNQNYSKLYSTKSCSRHRQQFHYSHESTLYMCCQNMQVEN